METTSKFIDFFENYKRFDLQLNELKANSEKEAFSNLMHGYDIINSLINSFEERIATSYNIFSILKNIYKDETRTHSPFLADLLNINGVHKQNELFYNEFLKILKIENKERFSPTIPSLQRVEIERGIGNGSMDVLISYFDTEKSFALGIENKINAKDQPKQLERYYNYLRSSYEDFLLIYLTPNGQLPAIPFSIDQKLYDDLIEKKKLILISYNKDITILIENTIGLIKAQKVYQIVIQYYEIIKSL